MFIQHLLLSCFLEIQIYSILVNFVTYFLLFIPLLSQIYYCSLSFVINFMIKNLISLNFFLIFIVSIFNFIALIFNFIISNHHSVDLLSNRL